MRCKHGFYGFPCQKIMERYDLKGNCIFEDPRACPDYEEYKEESE
ncbi:MULTISPECIES: hypothetical protein [Methanobacterium]|nr:MULTISPECIES: hypothetical protein [Methanobacterium]